MSEFDDIIAATIVKATTFREYIGKDELLDDFPDKMININMEEFHFILCFATDTYVDRKSTGVFGSTWNMKTFSPENVAKLKKKYKNKNVEVKVVISIGGNDPRDQFNPEDKQDWIRNATSSIREIILEYQNEFPNDDIIDGIDINYGKIISSVNDFSNCIGQVIQQLKEQLQDNQDVSKSMNVVSIAPTALFQSHYRQLYLDNKDNIDLIDYKFYDQSFITKKEVETLFKTLISSDEYGDTASKKLLVGVSTHDDIQSKKIIAGCKYLLDHESLVGVFVWDDKASAPTYVAEQHIQKLLTKY